MTGTLSSKHTPWLRGSVAICTALLVASCGSNDDGGAEPADSGGDSGGAADSTSETLTEEEFSISANQLCGDLLVAPIADDPAAYADAADQLEALPRADDDDGAADLATAMRTFVTAQEDLIDQVEEIPGFESPPGTWMVVENGSIFVSRTGMLADIEDSGLPQSTGMELLDAQEALSDAAWRVEAPKCAAVVLTE